MCASILQHFIQGHKVQCLLFLTTDPLSVQYLSALSITFGDDGIQVTRAYEAYGELSLFADIGGYVGMFLGLSFSQLTELTNYVFTRLFE